MKGSPSPHAPVDIRHPKPFGICDRCGFRYLRCDLTWQMEWRGLSLQSLNRLVCPECLDKPQDQFRPIIIGPDPVPVRDPRPGFYLYQMGVTPQFDILRMIGGVVNPDPLFDTSGVQMSDSYGNPLTCPPHEQEQPPPNSSDRPGYPDQIYDTSRTPIGVAVEDSTAWPSENPNLQPYQDRVVAAQPLQPGQVIPGGFPYAGGLGPTPEPPNIIEDDFG